MDALDRLAPAARPLLAEVDAALLGIGTPRAHPVSRLMGTVGSTPAQVTDFVAGLEPLRLREAAAVLRRQASAYEQVSISARAPGEGAAAGHLVAATVALAEHLAAPGSRSLAGRLRTQAAAVEDAADWQQALRDDLARALAGVIASTEAVTLRLSRRPEPGDLRVAALAAAEIGAVLLEVVAGAAVAGRDLLRGTVELEDLAYQAPAGAGIAYDGPIRQP